MPTLATVKTERVETSCPATRKTGIVVPKNRRKPGSLKAVKVPRAAAATARVLGSWTEKRTKSRARNVAMAPKRKRKA
jgi:hypothetical protein